MSDKNNNDQHSGPTDGSDFDLERGFRLGDIEVYPQQLIVNVGERTENVEHKAMEVLLCLVRHREDTVTRDQFFDEVWANKVVEPGNLDVAISALRRTLGDDAKVPLIIRTVPNVGYRLIADVRPLKRAKTKPPRWRPWAIAAGIVVAVATVAVLLPPPDDPSDPTTISVQCFENLSDQPDSEYFAEGLADEIRAALSGLDGVRVVSRAASQAQCGSGLPISKIGEKLDADKVLEGSVRRNADRIRISVQLGDAATDQVVLSESYSGAFADIFELQNRIARDVAARLQVELAPDAQLVTAPTDDLDAYQLYLRAHFQLRRRGVEPVRRAIELFQAAIARDPAYGRAYQGLAEAFAVAPNYTGAEVGPYIEMSLAALEKAETLGGVDSHADAIRGFIHFHSQQWEKARVAYEAALIGEPDDSDLLQWHSQFLASLGYIERSRNQAQMSVTRDPLSPIAHQRLGIVSVWAGDLDGADAQFRIAIEELGLEPTANARSMFPLMLRRGQIVQARKFAEEIFSAGGVATDWVEPWAAHVQGDADAAPAVEALRAAYDSGQLSSRVYIGALYYVDDADALFEAIDRATAARNAYDHEMWFVEEGRVLQNDPRFPELLERAGIIAYWDAHGWPDGCRREAELIRCGGTGMVPSLSAGDPPVS